MSSEIFQIVTLQAKTLGTQLLDTLSTVWSSLQVDDLTNPPLSRTWRNCMPFHAIGQNSRDAKSESQTLRKHPKPKQFPTASFPLVFSSYFCDSVQPSHKGLQIRTKFWDLRLPRHLLGSEISEISINFHLRCSSDVQANRCSLCQGFHKFSNASPCAVPSHECGFPLYHLPPWEFRALLG